MYWAALQTHVYLILGIYIYFVYIQLIIQNKLCNNGIFKRENNPRIWETECLWVSQKVKRNTRLFIGLYGDLYMTAVSPDDKDQRRGQTTFFFVN